MKKITFNAPLNHKAYSYEPMQIEVEKVIPLYGKRFEQMRDHPLENAPEIIDNRDLMYMEGNTAHCILFLDANGSDGILVEAEGADYARKSQFIPNARAIIEANDITAGERQLHAELKGIAERIAELAHNGQQKFNFEEMLGDGDMKATMIQAVAEILDRRDDLEEVRDHYLGIAGQHDFTVTANASEPAVSSETVTVSQITTITLKENDMSDQAEEMHKRIFSSRSYYEALNVIGEYVEFCSAEEMAEEPDEGMSMA